MMTDVKFEVNATDEEIRTWMDAEIVRLGEWFRDFTITWHRNERYHWLEMWSNSMSDFSIASNPVGKGFRIGVVPTNEDWMAVPVLQQEGRKLYYCLKKDYPVTRDLSRR